MRGIHRAFVFLGLVCAAAAAPAQSGADPARGEALARPCAACHGTPDRGPLPLTPSLARQPEDAHPLCQREIVLSDGKSNMINA